MPKINSYQTLHAVKPIDYFTFFVLHLYFSHIYHIETQAKDEKGVIKARFVASNMFAFQKKFTEPD